MGHANSLRIAPLSLCYQVATQQVLFNPNYRHHVIVNPFLRPQKASRYERAIATLPLPPRVYQVAATHHSNFPLKDQIPQLMLKSKIYQQVDNITNNGTPGHLSRPWNVFTGEAIASVATIDNRELTNADGIMQLSGFGMIYDIDPTIEEADDLKMVLGAERDLQREVVLFDQVFTGDTTFRIDIQFQLVGQAYQGVSTISFSTGEVVTRPFEVSDCGGNNFTAIQFRNTKLSSSGVKTAIRMFNTFLFK